MTTWSSRTTYQGHAINQGTKQILAAANKLLASDYFGSENGDMTMLQGGYNRGGVAASAGTHDGGGAFDLTPFNWKNRIKVLRILGCAAWHRPYNWDRRGGGEHIHVEVCGDGTASAGGKAQVEDYYDGLNGLANRAKDADWRPAGIPILFHLDSSKAVRYAKKDITLRNAPAAAGASRGTLKKGAKFTPIATVKNSSGNYWVINVDGKCAYEGDLTKTAPTTTTTPKPVPVPAPVVKATIRPVTFNFPDKTKVTTGTEAERAKRAAALLKAQNPSFIGFNELVGPGKDGVANTGSALSQTMASALGTGYRMIVPTTAYNENYVALNTSKTDLVKKYDDAKIYAGDAPGKHVTRLVLKDKASGLVYVLGQTHLGSSGEASDAERQAQAVKVMAALKEVSKLHGNAPIIVQGDMNESLDLKGFVDGGLVNVRKVAKATTNAKFSTYVNQKDVSPNISSDWIIDQIYVPKTWTVNGYTVVIDGTTATFVTPRISDHLPVVASVTN